MSSAKTVSIDGLEIGGNNPVRVESMLKTPLTDIQGCIKEADLLFENGCELARVAFPDLLLAGNLKRLIFSTKLKLMADIHFNHELAIKALDCGCPSIRINPGNMTGQSAIRTVVNVAKNSGAVIRIGANGGSLNNKQIALCAGDRAVALANAVTEQVNILEQCDFRNTIISAKSSDIKETLRANQILAQRYIYPMHIGITEAGFGRSGVVKGSAGIAAMLLCGIGDTIRVSLTGSPVDEVKVGYDILRSLKIREHGYTLVSCPTCGRRRIEVSDFVKRVEKLIPKNVGDGITIAVMGCEVNGPREASNADLGIAGTPSGAVIFRHGKTVCNLDKEELEAKLPDIIKSILE